MPITDYRKLLEQVFNIQNFKFNGKMDYETEEDKQYRAKQEFEKLKKEGKINWV